ncbi:MSMEG_0570 family nitrogen starvation response protein [Jidongwangia harbinensis]|uniref:MSMEG_0570 family nitrogen starvation response protein n=1 Tax=Jidongwangia harbinensis TaxID=2878561 RepID=UPI001CDA4A65|nr:MSMEG_0570 family nitrogen starvation response protein [Jidongwangia harbinensis]MCA2217166.1 MSMEG_0570 family nitrogen starvation response protein [Jidongwangia harbinensis]
MPERYVSVRWPDGPAQRIYSPSTVVEDYFAVGQAYPVDEFVATCREALLIAGDRVRAAYGFPCGSASRSIALVEAHAAAFPDGDVVVEGIGS